MNQSIGRGNLKDQKEATMSILTKASQFTKKFAKNIKGNVGVMIRT